MIIDNEAKQDASTSEKTISQSNYEEQRSQDFLKIQHYSFLDAQPPHPKTKEDLTIQYFQARKESLEENKNFIT